MAKHMSGCICRIRLSRSLGGARCLTRRSLPSGQLFLPRGNETMGYCDTAPCSMEMLCVQCIVGFNPDGAVDRTRYLLLSSSSCMRYVCLQSRRESFKAILIGFQLINSSPLGFKAWLAHVQGSNAILSEYSDSDPPSATDHLFWRQLKFVTVC